MIHAMFRDRGKEATENYLFFSPAMAGLNESSLSI